MPTYLVDRDLPGITRDQLAAAHRAAAETARRFTNVTEVLELSPSTHTLLESKR